MDAKHTVPSLSEGPMRRYVLDSLAAGHSVSIQTSDDSIASRLFTLGTRMGAKISIQNSVGSSKSMVIRLDSEAGTAHFDLYRMH